MRRLSGTIHKLDELVNGQPTPGRDLLGTTRRLSAYSLAKDGFNRDLFQTAKELRAGQKAAYQTVAVAQIGGGTKVAMGTMSMIAGANLIYRRRNTETLLADASIAYCAGTSVAAAVQLMNLVKGEVLRARLKKQQQLPTQLMQARLDQLESIEVHLKERRLVPAQ